MRLRPFVDMSRCRIILPGPQLFWVLARNDFNRLSSPEKHEKILEMSGANSSSYHRQAGPI
jgi:hypothetical protein